MEVITIETQAFKDLIVKIDAISHLLSAKEGEPKDKWIVNDELIKLLGISKRTAQLYRDKNLIAYSQIGNKIYYRLSDVEEMMKANYHHVKEQHNQKPDQFNSEGFSTIGKD